jgi:hypothetical protein
MTAPDKIWAEMPEIFDDMGFWQERKSVDLVEYTRSDLIPTAAYVARLEDAGRMFLRAYDQETDQVITSYYAMDAALSARPDAHDVRVVTVAQLDRWFHTARPMHGSNELDTMVAEIRTVIGGAS